MRKILVIFVVFFLVGCTTAQSNNLVGSWKYTDDGNTNSTIELTLLSDGTYVEMVAIPAMDMGGTYRGKYTVNGSELTLSPRTIDADDPSVWGLNPTTYQFKLEQEKLTLISDSEELVFNKYVDP